MAYIGQSPSIGNFQVCDAISTVDGQAAYTMQVSSVNVVPETANHMIVSLNGIIQAPGSSYTVAGSTITFASNLVTGDVINFIHILGSVLDLGVPSDSTVSLAKLTATGTKNSTTFLRGDNTFNAPPLGGITVAGQWRITTSFTGAVNPLANNWEENDTNYSRIGSAMSQSSGVFTFPETGVYIIEFQRVASLNGDDRFTTNYIAATTDNSSYTNIAYGDAHIKQAGGSTGTTVIASTFFDVTNTSTHKIRFQVANVNGSTQTVGSSTQNITFATFIRLGDT